MNKKIVFTALIATALLVALFWMLTKDDGYFPDKVIGQVIEVRKNSVLISGKIANENTAAKTFEFLITPETVFEHTHFVVTPEQIKTGQTVKPTIIKVAGKFTDLKPGTKISVAKSKEDLSKYSKVAALEIHYFTEDLPEPKFYQNINAN